MYAKTPHNLANDNEFCLFLFDGQQLIYLSCLMKSRDIGNPSTDITENTFHSHDLCDFENMPHLGEASLQDLDNPHIGGMIEIDEDEVYEEVGDSYDFDHRHPVLPFNEYPEPIAEPHYGQRIFGYVQDSEICARSQSAQPEDLGERHIKKPEKELSGGKNSIKVEPEENFYHKFKKNVNMPKAIGRYLMNYYHHFQKSLFYQDPEFFQQLSAEFQDRKVWVRRSKKNSIKLKDLQGYFGEKIRSKRQSCLTRLMMRKILHKWSRKEILPNNQVKDKLEYLVAAKVFSLRCSNSGLATRMQMR